MARPRKLAESAIEKEMSQIETGAKVRYGLGLKFAGPVTVAISLAIIVMGLVLYSAMADALEYQMNMQGVFAAKIAAAPEIDSWESEYNTRKDLLDRLTRIEVELAMAGGSGSIAAAAGGETELQQELIERIHRYERRQKEFNRSRLRGLLGSVGALDVWVIRGRDDLRASAVGGQPSYQIDARYQLPSSPDSEIMVGSYRNPRGQMERARFFGHPIRNRKGDKVGWATVVVSEEYLRNELASVKQKVWLFCIFSIVICVVVSLLTSKVITRPLHLLLRDIKTVAGGDLEHRTRIHSQDEIGTLASAFDQMTRNLAAAEVMRVDLADKSHQVSIAHEVQERLFPQDLPHQFAGLSLDAGNRLSGDLSSDLFDTVELEGGTIGCLVMTASGRGVPAAIILSMARAIFRARALAATSPAEALRELNRNLAADLRRGMYVSAIYAVIDPETGVATIACAGHRVPALHYVAAKEGLARIHPDGIALGLDRGPVFDRSLTEATVTLESGDRLLLATEGAFLLKGKDGKPVGETPFLKLVLAMCKRGASPSGILASLDERLADDPGKHDLTVVAATKS